MKERKCLNLCSGDCFQRAGDNERLLRHLARNYMDKYLLKYMGYLININNVQPARQFFFTFEVTAHSFEGGFFVASSMLLIKTCFVHRGNFNTRYSVYVLRYLFVCNFVVTKTTF